MIRQSRVLLILLAVVLALVVLATFASGQTVKEHFVAMPVSFIDDAASGPQGGKPELLVAAGWWKEWSYGAWTLDMQMAPSVALAMMKPKTCDYQSWNSKVATAAQALGLYGTSMFFHPALSCPEHANAAQATCGYGSIWFNGQDSDEIVAHEIGHHFGICPHSSRVAALYPIEHFSLHGAYVQERGHHYSIMGGSHGHPFFQEKVTLGLLDRSQSTLVLRGMVPMVVTLNPIEQSAGILNVSAYRQDGLPYSVEMRTPVGTDKDLTGTPAFAVHVGLNGYTAWVGDLDPDQPVLDDFEGGVKIEYVSASMTSGQIRISTYAVAAIPDPTPAPYVTPRPTVPYAGDCWVLKPYLRCSPTPTQTAPPAPTLTSTATPPLPVPTDTPSPGPPDTPTPPAAATEPPAPAASPTRTPAVFKTPVPVGSSGCGSSKKAGIPGTELAVFSILLVCRRRAR